MADANGDRDLMLPGSRPVLPDPDMAAGWDNILQRDHLKTNISISAVNLTNKYALYNFLSTFSGTHFVSPRTVSAQISFNF